MTVFELANRRGKNMTVEGKDTRSQEGLGGKSKGIVWKRNV